jgi:hypothetical protein
MAAAGEKTWPYLGRNRWPLTPSGRRSSSYITRMYNFIHLQPLTPLEVREALSAPAASLNVAYTDAALDASRRASSLAWFGPFRASFLTS